MQRSKNTTGHEYVMAGTAITTRAKSDTFGPMLTISSPGCHVVRITRHEAACILWDAWRKLKAA